MKYYTLFISRFLSHLKYKNTFMLLSFSSLVAILLKYYLWNSVYNSGDSNSILGLSFQDMKIYIFISSITFTLILTDIEHEISKEVLNGSISIQLIRPINYIAQKISYSMAQSVINLIFIAMPIVIVMFAFINFEIFEKLNWSIFMFSIFGAICINVLLSVLTGLASFWTTNIWGLQMFKMSLISFFGGSLIPINMLPKIMRDISFWLPFESLIYNPAFILLQKTSDEFNQNAAILKSVIWIIAILSLTLFVWKLGRRRLEIQGG